MNERWDGLADPLPKVFDRDTASPTEVAAELSRLAEGGALAAARALAAFAVQRFPTEKRFVGWKRVLEPGVARVLPADPSRTSSAEIRQWLQAHGKPHVGQWVALEHSRLLAFGSTPEEVRPALEDHPEGVVMQVLPELVQ